MNQSAEPTLDNQNAETNPGLMKFPSPSPLISAFRSLYGIIIADQGLFKTHAYCESYVY